MFTTGSKLFLGATSLATVVAAWYAAVTGGDTGWTASVGLITLVLVLVFLTALNFYVRDNNVSAMHEDAVSTAPAAQDPPGTSMWPAVAALGGGLVVVGVVTEPIVFKAGLVVVLAVLLEWLVQSWSERASSDPAYNASLRKRILHPLEFPVLAAVGLAIVIFSFSRIMLFLTKGGGPVAFALLAALVLFFGFLFATRQSVKRSVTLGVCAIAALGLVSTGAVMAIDGEREIHQHGTVASEPDVCASNEETEVDDRGSQDVAAAHSVAATVVYDGTTLIANPAGIHDPQSTITVPRSTPTGILFENESDQDVRLSAHLGTFTTVINGTPVKESPVTCTTLIEPGGRSLLTLEFPKSSLGTESPYVLSVPGVDSTIEIVVP